MFNQILGLYGLKMRDGAGLERGAAGGVRRNRPRSSVVVFEPPAGLTATTAVGINNKGQVAIGSDAGVFLWERGAYTHLGPGYPTAINGEGWILGTTPRGVAIFRKGHRSQPLSINLIPTGFNDCGEVSGYVGPGCSGCGSHALYWHAGQLTTLAPSSGPADHLGARALGLNNRGQVVGTSESDTSQGRTHALIWSDGRVSDLGCFGGDHAAARGINDRGQIIVTSYSVATCMARTFLVDGGRVIELGIGLRTFYREIELVKRCGIKVQNKDRKFSLLTTAEQAERRLPFTDPHLSFAEMADLSRHPGPASRRLAELLARVTHHPDLAVASSRSAGQGKATHSSPGN
jgi:probable HAF family extracellular repeat protein